MMQCYDCYRYVAVNANLIIEKEIINLAVIRPSALSMISIRYSAKGGLLFSVYAGPAVN